MANTTLTLTGAAAIAAGPLLHALLRRRFAFVQFCAELPELADLQAHPSIWCEALGFPTARQWIAEEPESSSVAQRLHCRAPEHLRHRSAHGGASRLRC